MKNIFKLLLSLSVILAVGCTEELDEAVESSVKFDESSVVFNGLIIAGRDYEYSESAPEAYITLNYTNTTGSAAAITVSSSVETNDVLGLKLDTSRLIAESGTGTITIPIYGNANFTGDQEISFSIFSMYSARQTVTLNVPIYTEYYDKEPLAIESVELEGFLLAAGGTTTKDGNMRLAINYTNGSGRVASFTIKAQDSAANTDLVFAQIDEYSLSASADQSTLYVEVTGDYATGDELDFYLDVFINVGDDDEEGTYVIEDYKFSLTEQTNPSVSLVGLSLSEMLCVNYAFSKNINIDYYFGENTAFDATDIEFEFVYKDVNGDLVDEQSYTAPIATASDVALNEYEGTLSVPMSWTPTEKGTLTITAKLGASLTITKELPVYVDKINDIKVKLISGTIIAAEKEAYEFEISYGDMLPYSDLAITNIAISGDTEWFEMDGAIITSLRTDPLNPQEPNSSVSFVLDEDFILSTYQVCNYALASGSVPVTLEMSIKYGATTLTEKFSVDFDVNCIISNDCIYKPLTIGSQVWLDRNLGATQIQSSGNGLVAVDGDGYPSTTQSGGYSYNKYSYGDYYQYGRTTGIPLIMENNPYYNQSGVDFYTSSYLKAPTSSTPFFKSASADLRITGIDEWRTGTWVEGYWTSNSFFTSANWTSDEDGGTANPCPEGYRLPSTLEAQEMVQTVTGLDLGDECTLNRVDNADLSAYYSLILPAMAEQLKFPFSGYILENGPTVNGTTPYTMGQKGIAGVCDANTYADADKTIEQRSGYIGLQFGYMCMWTCDMNSTSSGGVSMEITNTVNISWPEKDANVAMPVRCIKHQ